MSMKLKHHAAGTGFSKEQLQLEFMSYALTINRAAKFASTLTENYIGVSEKYISSKLVGNGKLSAIEKDDEREVDEFI